MTEAQPKVFQVLADPSDLSGLFHVGPAFKKLSGRLPYPDFFLRTGALQRPCHPTSGRKFFIPPNHQPPSEFNDPTEPWFWKSFQKPN
jgi:hypothetical protein